jgi:hypothetical protein
MAITFMKSKDFKQSLSRVKKAATDTTVFITEYGKPAFVMLNVTAYRQLLYGVGLPTSIEEFETIMLGLDALSAGSRQNSSELKG